RDVLVAVLELAEAFLVLPIADDVVDALVLAVSQEPLAEVGRMVGDDAADRQPGVLEPLLHAGVDLETQHHSEHALLLVHVRYLRPRARSPRSRSWTGRRRGTARRRRPHRGRPGGPE